MVILFYLCWAHDNRAIVQKGKAATTFGHAVALYLSLSISSFSKLDPERNRMSVLPSRGGPRGTPLCDILSLSVSRMRSRVSPIPLLQITALKEISRRGHYHTPPPPLLKTSSPCCYPGSGAQLSGQWDALAHGRLSEEGSQR